MTAIIMMLGLMITAKKKQTIIEEKRKAKEAMADERITV
jgi:hypothetical protein